MQIILTDTGKRFNREWIFRHLGYHFTSNRRYAITGPNGSGKSTLLQVIAGSLSFNEGSITFANEKEVPGNEKKIRPEEYYQSISIATPYLELIDEMTAIEFLEFHTQFKNLLPNLVLRDIPSIAGLENELHKQIRYYSSGMKQRLKLVQAFFSDTALLLLDEPTTNLDAEGVLLYHQLIKNYTKDRIVIIGSNDEQEYSFCEEVININAYK